MLLIRSLNLEPGKYKLRSLFNLSALCGVVDLHSMYVCMYVWLHSLAWPFSVALVSLSQKGLKSNKEGGELRKVVI